MTTREVQRLYQEIGASIASARRKRGFSQEKLASALQLARTSLANIERGRQHIQLHTLYAVSECLDLAVVDVLPERSFLGTVTSSASTLSNVEWLQKLNVNMPAARVEDDEEHNSRAGRTAS